MAWNEIPWLRCQLHSNLLLISICMCGAVEFRVAGVKKRPWFVWICCLVYFYISFVRTEYPPLPSLMVSAILWVWFSIHSKTYTFVCFLFYMSHLF